MKANALVIIAHPSRGSFSHAVADVAARALADRGYDIVAHDLYVEGFNPVQPSGEFDNRSSPDALVETHCRDLARADFIVVCHPNWWGQPPAMLKGWLDRVCRLGLAYDYPPNVGAEGLPVGLLRAKAALVFNTSNTPWPRELQAFGNPLERLWRDCVFGLCGVSQVEQRMFAPMASSTAEERAAWLDDVGALIAKYA